MQDTVIMMETMRTICGTEPKKGLMSCASCVAISLVLRDPMTRCERPYSAAKRIRQTRQGSRAHAASLREPHVRVPCRRGQNEGLRESCQDLSEHHDPEDAA